MSKSKKNRGKDSDPTQTALRNAKRKFSDMLDETRDAVNEEFAENIQSLRVVLYSLLYRAIFLLLSQQHFTTVSGWTTGFTQWCPERRAENQGTQDEL